MKQHHAINYVDFPARDLAATKKFFAEVFGWEFIDYGPEYSAFSGQGIDGGFYLADSESSSGSGSALIVLYSENLSDTLAGVEAAAGRIVRPIFSFPGGRRFHFIEPSGNELAVWSDVP